MMFQVSLQYLPLTLTVYSHLTLVCHRFILNSHFLHRHEGRVHLTFISCYLKLIYPLYRRTQINFFPPPSFPLSHLCYLIISVFSPSFYLSSLYWFLFHDAGLRFFFFFSKYNTSTLLRAHTYTRSHEYVSALSSEDSCLLSVVVLALSCVTISCSCTVK